MKGRFALALSINALALSRTAFGTDFFITGVALPLFLANAAVPKANPVAAAALGAVKTLDGGACVANAHTVAIEAFSGRTTGLRTKLSAALVTSPTRIAHALTLRATLAVGPAHCFEVAHHLTRLSNIQIRIGSAC